MQRINGDQILLIDGQILVRTVDLEVTAEIIEVGPTGVAGAYGAWRCHPVMSQRKTRQAVQERITQIRSSMAARSLHRAWSDL